MSTKTNGVTYSDVNRVNVNEDPWDEDLKCLDDIQILIPEMKRHFAVISQKFNQFLSVSERLEKLASDYRALQVKHAKLENELEEWKAEEKRIEQNLEVNAENRVYLDVGGQRFTTTIRTLVEKTNSSYFKSLFHEKWDKAANSYDEPIFIDRDGHSFNIILKYLRTGELNIDDKTNPQELLLEAKFYRLSALEDELNALSKRNDLPATTGNSSDTTKESPPNSPAPGISRARSSPLHSNLSTSARAWTPSTSASPFKSKLHPAQTASSWRLPSTNERPLNVFTDSVLLTNDYEDRLFEFLPSNIQSSQQTWRLIYRASEHGFDAADFHRYCDNQAPTISIIQTDYGNIFGGYTMVPWSSAMQRADQADPTAFLFTLKNTLNVPPMKFPVAKDFEHQAISQNPTCGPNFGSPKNEGSDLCLRGKFNEKTNCVFFPRSYMNPTNESALIFAKKYFACKEVEVFALIDNN